MELAFQLLDCDYVLVNNKPIIRMFGKTKENKSVCAFYNGFLPYFYILPKKGLENKIVEFFEGSFKHLLVSIEGVEKYKSIGFQPTKTKILKITLNDPSQVAAVRENLRNKEFIEETFEADILFKYRFMTDFDIYGMKWVKATGKIVKTQTIRSDISIDAESIEPIEDDTNVSMKHMALDIEVVPGKEGIPDATKDPIIMVSLSFFPAYEGKNTVVLVSKPVKKPERDIMSFRSEKDMLENFARIMNNYSPDILTGYNINNFDLPYLLERLRINKISRAIGRCQQKQGIARKFGIRFRNVIVGRIVVDVYELVKESVDKGLLRIKRYGLGDVSRALLGEDKIDITHSEIGKYWNGNDEEVKKLTEYSRKDAELALKLLLQKDMLGKFIELSKVSGLLLQDTLDSREAARVENLVLREFNKKDFVIPGKPQSQEVLRRMEEREAKGLKGALVLEPQVGLHTNCVVYLDFRSMYPSIFISYNICPTTLITGGNIEGNITTPYGAKFTPPKIREGILPKIVKRLIEERDKVKKEMAKTNDENEKKKLDAKQYALKIMTNAFYGYTGYTRARFYVLDIANAITSCGRYLIQKTKSIVESDKNYKVVYGDTDSIMVELATTDLEEAVKAGESVSDVVNKELEGIVRIKIENVFKTLLVLTKKRYAGWSFEKTNEGWKDKIVMKGIETVRRDWCDLVSKTLFGVIEIVLKEQNSKKAFSYVKEILVKLDKNEIPIESLVVTKGISKPLKDYKGVQPHIELVKKIKKRSPGGAPGIGDRIGYVIVKGSQLMSERAEDPDYIKEHGLKIDSKYYLESQLLPPLERVFEALKINKADLVGMGRQMLLADAIKGGLKKQPCEEALKDIDGFICNRCNKTYRRPPLIGKCSDCGGELLFFLDETRSRYLSI